MVVNAGECTALVIGEEAATMEVIREHLSRSGVRVSVAPNGWEALKQIKSGPVDVVILALTATEVDGSNVREKFLLDPGLREIPFVFLIPEGRSEKAVRALRSGVDECVREPVDPVLLVARVQAAMDRRSVHERMDRLDALTRLLNWHTFENQVAEELDRVARYERFACIALLDLDDFGRFNNEFGQPTGDLLLACLGGAILTSVRHVDITGRHRDEKLLFYLPETKADGAECLLTRLLDQFREVSDKVAGVKVTFSVGIVETPEHGTDLIALLARAEEAVRHAKEAGKARIVVWDAGWAASTNG